MSALADWCTAHPFEPLQVDCATAVMLKILDGKCKMDLEEKVVMAALYDQVKHLPGELLGAESHQLIAESRDNLDDETRRRIYEERVLAESRISRPVMKGFKAWIRAEGLFDTVPFNQEQDDE